MAEANEGITPDDDGGNTMFHRHLLGTDRLPSEVLEVLRQRARDRGLDADVLVQR